jgi:hypothetical protein
LHRQRLTIAGEIGDRRRAADARIKLALADLTTGDLPAAEAGLTESLAALRTIGHQRGLAFCLAGLGQLAHHAGAYAVARERWRESLAIAERVGDRLAIGAARGGLGYAAGILGDAAAHRDLAEAVSTLLEIGAIPAATQVVVAEADLLPRGPASLPRAGRPTAGRHPDRRPRPWAGDTQRHRDRAVLDHGTSGVSVTRGASASAGRGHVRPDSRAKRAASARLVTTSLP